MNTIDAIMGRRTAHFYTSDPVSEEALRIGLEAAIRAPNHKLTNPWRFIRVGPKTREKLVDLAVEIKSAKSPLSDAQTAKLRRKVGSSPVLIVLSQVLADDPLRRKEDYAAMACAVQNFCLALWDQGYATKWSTGGWTRHAKTYAYLDVDPERQELVGAIMVGKADDVCETSRRPVEEVLREVP